MEKILLYGFENYEKKDDLYSILKENNINLVEAGKDELCQSIGYILGLDGFEKNENEEEKDFNSKTNFMMFCDFTEKRLYEIIGDLKEKDIYIPHKAVLTETNKNWTLFYMINHIEEEHRLVMKYQNLCKCIKKAQEIKNPKLNVYIEEAEKLRVDKNLTEEKLDEMLEKFMKLF